MDLTDWYQVIRSGRPDLMPKWKISTNQSLSLSLSLISVSFSFSPKRERTGHTLIHKMMCHDIVMTSFLRSVLDWDWYLWMQPDLMAWPDAQIFISCKPYSQPAIVITIPYHPRVKYDSVGVESYPLQCPSTLQLLTRSALFPPMIQTCTYIVTYLFTSATATLNHKTITLLCFDSLFDFWSFELFGSHFESFICWLFSMKIQTINRFILTRDACWGTGWQSLRQNYVAIISVSTSTN